MRPALGFIESETESNYVRPQVMDLLLLLVRAGGGIVSKDEITAAIWRGRFTAESSLTRAVAELRRALGDSAQKPEFIENLPKRGYRLIAEVEMLEAESPKEPSIAVLPLENLAGDAEVGQLADGISEELINTLARLSGIAVVARTSSFAFRDRRTGARELGQALGAGYILDGAVQRDGGVLRITVQLIRAEDGMPLWSERFDRLDWNLFALEEEIARLVLDQMRVAVTPDERTRLTRVHTGDADAHALHRLGRYHLGQRSPAAVMEAIRCFEKAVARDPEYAAPWSGLADGYAVLGFLGFAAPDEAFPRVKEGAERALAIDPLLGEAHTSRAAALGLHERKWAAATESFERGCALAPHAAHSHLWFGIFLGLQGEFGRAWAELQQARRLDPLSMPVLANLGLLLYFMGRTEEAIECHRHVLVLDPQFPLALVHLGRALLQAGRAEEALAPLQASAATGFGWALGFLGMALGRAGRREEARAVLRQFDRLAQARYVNPVLRACVHLGLDEPEAACGEIEAALRGNDPLITILAADPLFDALRGRPQFEAVLRELDFPAACGGR